jgi:hypothetical protein
MVDALTTYILWQADCTTPDIGPVKEKAIHRESTVRPPFIPRPVPPTAGGPEGA